MRSVASGYRELPLDGEVRSARSVLTGADIDVRLHVDCGELPSHVATVLAVVLREGVTNALRHGQVTECAISIRREAGDVVLDLVNDGARRRGVVGDQDPNGGNGMTATCGWCSRTARRMRSPVATSATTVRSSSMPRSATRAPRTMCMSSAISTRITTRPPDRFRTCLSP